MEIPKAYTPQEAEDKILALWEKNDLANPDTCIKKGITKKNAKSFSIVLPPPNVTGTLHMGHAAMLATEDILIRFHRMQGYKTLWLPGTDHAAIATESKVEQMLYKTEGKTRHDLGRSEFLKRVEQFAKESHDTILHQIKKMGASLDWSREAYTLDQERNHAVATAFQRMHEGGLIYRGDRIVNWDPKMQTTVSDDEIEWKEEKASFYYLQYGPFVISTARPETKFGDKYVVMHPKDKRYKEYTHGQKIELEWISGPVTATVIKDEAIDMEFGTGVMTITPWHDTTDFEIAGRHNLDKEQIIDLKGKLLPIAKEFAGMHITKARPLIIQKLQEKGLVKKIDENYIHRIAINSRGGGVIEPQIMRQWFVDVSKPFAFPHIGLKSVKKGEFISLKELMARVVKKKEIEILPKRFEKTYFHWIDNLRDWCISRQIWFGHQIPVWYKGKETYVGTKAPKEGGRSGSEEPSGRSTLRVSDSMSSKRWTQDTDTLDTWFSSGLWTFSTMGWPFDFAQGKPQKNSDLATYHPTSVLETGYDILFFWIARMILMTTYLIGQVPFKTVYLHGLVRDDKGRKMSKSLGNIIDPLDMITKYGADATRLSLIIGAAPGNDIKISEDKVRGYRNFVNKIWNISRFLAMNTQDFGGKPSINKGNKKLLNDFLKITKEVTKNIESFRLSQAAETLYHYTWHTFADKIIEESKKVLEDPKTRASRQYVLLTIFSELLKLLHPFIPFVTEELYQQLPVKNRMESLMIEHWPTGK